MSPERPARGRMTLPGYPSETQRWKEKQPPRVHPMGRPAWLEAGQGFAGVWPVSELKYNYRQKSGSKIIDNAIRVLNGDPKLDTAPDFKIAYTANDDITLETVNKLINYLGQNKRLDDTVILSPYSKVSSLSTEKINELVKEYFNPENLTKLAEHLKGFLEKQQISPSITSVSIESNLAQLKRITLPPNLDNPSQRSRAGVGGASGWRSHQSAHHQPHRLQCEVGGQGRSLDAPWGVRFGVVVSWSSYIMSKCWQGHDLKSFSNLRDHVWVFVSGMALWTPFWTSLQMI